MFDTFLPNFMVIHVINVKKDIFSKQNLYFCDLTLLFGQQKQHAVHNVYMGFDGLNHC